MSIFSQIRIPKVKKSTFDLSEESKLSMNMGDLVPICMKEVLPGDKFSINTELLIKFAPLAAPVMHRIQAYVHYFFVPTTQIWKGWEDFINPKVNVNNDVVLPTIKLAIKETGRKGTLYDYMGLPYLENGDPWGFTNKFSVLPFLAYQHIYNSYYRDENLQPFGTTSASPIDVSSIDLDHLSNTQISQLTFLRKRAWAKDYFTSALPSPQAGDDVLIPVETEIQNDGNPLRFMTRGTPVTAGNPKVGPITQTQGENISLFRDPNNNDLFFSSGLKGSNISATINDLRKALALQRFKELAERGGTRYSEMVRNFFDTYLPDWYVDRPIFLGGSKQPINIGEVVQTSSTDTTTEQALGGRAGIANSYGVVKTAHLKAPCHGFLVGILSVRPQATYQQGVERMWTRSTLYDYPFPQFSHLGEQEILNKEIKCDHAQPNGVFGYTPRYAEWKEGHCHVCGEFRDTLDYWHFGRKFTGNVNLNGAFVTCDPTTRPFVVTDGQTEHLYVNLINNIRAVRPLPYFGTPSII